MTFGGEKVEELLANFGAFHGSTVVKAKVRILREASCHSCSLRCVPARIKKPAIGGLFCVRKGCGLAIASMLLTICLTTFAAIIFSIMIHIALAIMLLLLDMAALDVFSML